MRARALIDLGRPQAALIEVEKALGLAGGAGGSGQRHQQQAEALQLHGLCLLHLERYDEAQKSLHAAIACEPNEAHCHYLLGYCHNECKRREPAEACLREALRLAPEEPVYLRALAELLVDIQRAAGGGSATPGDAGKGEKGPLAEALELARKAVALGADRASNHITLGFVSSAAGDRAAARACYQRALAIDPNNALAWNNLGCVDLAQGRPMQARERFREALRLNPEGSVARDNLKLVQPGKRPGPIYSDYAAFERQLIVEVWENVLFGPSASRPVADTQLPAGGARISPPMTPRQFFRSYFFPKKLTDDPRLHAAALVWATDFRALPHLLLRMPQIIVWLGASLGLLRLGPAGIAVALSSNAVTYLFSRQPLKRRYEHYQQELERVKSRWHERHDAWLRGDIERAQRDAAIDRMIDEFSRYAELLRERLHAEESAD